MVQLQQGILTAAIIQTGITFYDLLAINIVLGCRTEIPFTVPMPDHFSGQYRVGSGLVLSQVVGGFYRVLQKKDLAQTKPE